MANKWPNTAKGRTCFLGWKKPLYVHDFYRNNVLISSFEQLYALYLKSEDQRIASAKNKLGLVDVEMEPDPFVDWLIRRGICPHAMVTTNSRYHFENCVMLDGEMGLKLPDPNASIGDTPALFFQALSTVRSARAKVREEENAQNNRNKDNG